MQFGAFHIREGIAHVLNSSLTKTAIQQVKKDIIDGVTKLLYVAPESLVKEDTIEFLKTVKLSFWQLMKHIVFQNGDMILDLNIEI